jgi:teichuronopeptide biosynthesis TupA-like protein
MLKTVKRIIGKVFPRLKDYSRIRAGYSQTFGKAPNLLFPKTFSEKVQRRKLFDRDPRYPQRVDKIEVKSFVREKLGDGWTTPTIWQGTKLPPMADRIWPIPFVLKASHGSVMNVFARSAAELDWDHVEKLCRKWENETYGDWGGEWVYSRIQPRLLVEPFIGELAALPIDYKLWTFNGRVEFIQVDSDREVSHKRTMFDRNWERLAFTIAHPIDERDIPCPLSLDAMISAAEILSQGVSYVRVDLYEINNSPRFGEMTYYPDSGWERFDPAEYDLKIGALWK